MQYFSGEILTEDGLEKGYIGFEKKKIVEIGNTCPKKPLFKGLIVPTFVNAHTHLGDSFIRGKNLELPKSIEKLVAPPDGLKFKLLMKASRQEIIQGIKDSLNEMRLSGVSSFCDFREGGLPGLKLIKTALKNSLLDSIILARPQGYLYDKNELKILVNRSNGIGVSSISDWNYDELRKISSDVKNVGKIFALHASERIREDIDLILDLKPDFLVHMLKASESDFFRVKDARIPIIICPRSNSYFGLKPDILMMKKIGIDLLLGTDNGMLFSPNVIEEARFLKSNFKNFSNEELIKMITYLPRKVLNLDTNILAVDSTSGFVVLDKKDLTTLYISK
jgi:cytosine/adenosine deaminase-related metal-dependent hydrolase